MCVCGVPLTILILVFLYGIIVPNYLMKGKTVNAGIKERFPSDNIHLNNITGISAFGPIKTISISREGNIKVW